MDKLLSIPKVAEILSVSGRTVYRLMGKEELHAVKLSGRWRIRNSDLTKFIEMLDKKEPEWKELKRRVEAWDLLQT